uniref:C2H2-type domain-containing protein n=1 Tax=Knipowitschia caucasica TaxID=637954 RepID=A0AAV2M665_KNICA
MSAVAAQTERRMEIQAPLTAVYIHTVPALPTQPALAVADPNALHLSMPPLYSKETLPFLTLHIAGGIQPGLSVTATPPAAKPKSAGKHLCPHCGRDCMKPSVLEKHLRCHTGERPYPCTVCGVSFKTQSNLYKHKRTQAHARLSSESEQSTVGSLDSLSRSTETASLFVDEPTDESMGAERNASLRLSSPSVTQTMDINDKNVTPKTEPLVTHFLADDKATKEHLPPSNRHVVLQRQEATLFSKQWDSSVSSKSKSHESTDSGFSESSEHYPSPGSLLPDHSMDSLTETSTEQGEDSNRQIETQEDKNATKEQENKSLEERISKLISQNSAVVEDKHLEHSVNQQSSNHRPLVRQAAVDCNNATEALSKNSSVDEACMSSPSSHGEADDTCGDTSNRKSRRKKAQKFAYNKWYMYGGGTFKKLYDMEKGIYLKQITPLKRLPWNQKTNMCHQCQQEEPNQQLCHTSQTFLQGVRRSLLLDVWNSPPTLGPLSTLSRAMCHCSQTEEALQTFSWTRSCPPEEPPSGAVRVVQSVVEAEDSSDDEGKLIIEL